MVSSTNKTKRSSHLVKSNLDFKSSEVSSSRNQILAGQPRRQVLPHGPGDLVLLLAPVAGPLPRPLAAGTQLLGADPRVSAGDLLRRSRSLVVQFVVSWCKSSVWTVRTDIYWPLLFLDRLYFYRDLKNNFDHDIQQFFHKNYNFWPFKIQFPTLWVGKPSLASFPQIFFLLLFVLLLLSLPQLFFTGSSFSGGFRRYSSASAPYLATSFQFRRLLLKWVTSSEPADDDVIRSRGNLQCSLVHRTGGGHELREQFVSRYTHRGYKIHLTLGSLCFSLGSVHQGQRLIS